MTAAEKLFNRIRRKTGEAIGDFNLIEEGDRILVGVSGGKDSYTLLHVLDALRRKAPIKYELIAVNVDPGFPGYRPEIIEDHLREHGFTCHMETTDSYAVIEEKLRPGSSYCAFCARLRRGVIYTLADHLGCNKVALGHHCDDFIETLLLNQFFVGRLAAMSAKMLADNGRHTVIRPLVYVEESDIREWVRLMDFPIVHCSCPAFGETDRNRQKMKQLVATLQQDIPDIRSSMISALGKVEPRYLLDRELQQLVEKETKED
ncbi:MAG: tRNA 2-thiocytidine(32) synthetase TtcA [Desulfuromonas sp.]|nr:MAG: tRNA 2-thiocytidine(32) synthetase TtcA [Desulfuromonas sp.]